jgi:hypothetical protein
MNFLSQVNCQVNRQVIWRVICAGLVLSIAGAPRLAPAADPASYSLDIPVEDLGTALLRFATVTHQQIAFDQAVVRNYRSSALSGSYKAMEGLRALVGTAPFLIGTTPSGALTVSADPAARAGVGAAAPAGTPRAPEEVIVRAQSNAQRRALRAKLMPQVSSFVYGIVAQEDVLARWHKKVCPLVSGLTRPQGEFILERVSQIARAAGAPVAGEDCKPNLYIFVTPQPQELLEAMEKRNYRMTFGGAPPTPVAEFIATPRAIRVWYTTPLFTPPVISGDSGGAAAVGGIAGAIGVGTATPAGAALATGVMDGDFSQQKASPPTAFPGPDGSGGSAGFWLIYVVVDQTRLQGVSLGQLADYVAMVGLARIRSNVHAGDASSILRLFDGSPQAAAAGMSDWDRAFLKTLYGVGAQGFQGRQPRAVLSLHVVREIVP